MLELTQQATDAIRGIVETDDGGELGLRITAEPSSDGAEPELGLAVAEGPLEGDDTIERDGVRVFLDESASSLLSDKVLDAHEHGDHVHFTIDEQGAPPRDHDHH